jgi:hypothetical protein
MPWLEDEHRALVDVPIVWGQRVRARHHPLPRNNARKADLNPSPRGGTEMMVIAVRTKLIAILRRTPSEKFTQVRNFRFTLDASMADQLLLEINPFAEG